MTRKTIAIHQPNYLPWAGYFLKMVACDDFVFHDNVQITKAGPTRRVKIASRHSIDKMQWLTVPLKKHSDFALIKDLKISWEADWTKKHLNQIKDTYCQCPYFSDFFPKIVDWYLEAKRFTSLSEMNVFFIKQIMNELDIKKEMHISSNLPVSGRASTYNLAITKHLNGTHYLSGLGGDKYQDEMDFVSQEVHLVRMDSMAELNLLLLEIEIPKLCFSNSVLELIFNIDKKKLKEIFSCSKFNIH